MQLFLKLEHRDYTQLVKRERSQEDYVKREIDSNLQLTWYDILPSLLSNWRYCGISTLAGWNDNLWEAAEGNR